MSSFPNISNLWLRFPFLSKLSASRSIVRLLHNTDQSPLSVEVFGHEFTHPIGTASGFDQDSILYNALGDYGYSFVTLGPLHPGKDLKAAIGNIQRDQPETYLFTEICASPKFSEEEDILKDILGAFSLIYDFTNAVILNINNSDRSTVEKIVDAVVEARLTYEENKPVLVKIPETATPSMAIEMTDMLRYCGVDGILVPGVEMVRIINEHAQGRFPIMGYSRIANEQDAQAMLQAGAKLITLAADVLSKNPNAGYKILKKLESDKRQ